MRRIADNVRMRARGAQPDARNEDQAGMSDNVRHVRIEHRKDESTMRFHIKNLSSFPMKSSQI
jgi:hypothetical protein